MRRLSYERRIQLLALAAGLPGSFIALILLWTGSYSSGSAWTLTFLILSLWLGFALSLRHRVVFSLQTLSNLLAAMREEDFSIRARGARPDDAMGEVMIEVNALSAMLREQRLGALEATGLLRTIIEEIDLAIFTFDHEAKLRLVNRAGERLLGRPLERLLGSTAVELGLAGCLEGESARTMDLAFPGASGRWSMRRGSFRQGGLPHQLVVLSDLSRTLRDEERQAWQRLIRVLGHELNNSLAPIQSVAQGLESGLNAANQLPELQAGPAAPILQDLQEGLAIIRSRTEALGRFMAAYSRLARLPKPKHLPVPVGDWVHRTAKLETRVKVCIKDGPRATISADVDQLEQLLINLIRNAADAALETHGGVQVGWSVQGSQVEVWVIDDGPGIPNTANLFVPFFTTKPAGSGIGLVLSRQIAEAHGGQLTLENRIDARGCEARLRLPF
ncbi:MAG: two-component system, NtrC family, nitrogen regulation sensor histidine kinase NtrY [Acidobacteriaceae bacterium]|jgi:two-component system nitrogen regulation sensor histidine kinase NtrY|nr:two-component system, NtrC family, nitrogen regulation sensor histidine kinase NtrY [Acidobacteriaceae bacterium]